MSKNTSPAYAPTSCWDRPLSAAGRRAMHQLAVRYMGFLTRCKTERETVAHALKTLEQHRIVAGREDTCLVRPFRHKSLFVALRGTLPLREGLHLICAHADTPRLDLKQRPFIEQAQVAQAKTHYYGGIRKYQWLARPLALHGTIVKADGSTVDVCLGERESEPVFTIADLLPHLAQKQNTKPVSEAFEAEKLNIILAHSPLPGGRGGKGRDDRDGKDDKDRLKAHVLHLLWQKYGICEEDCISAELQAVPAGPARFVGLDNALVGGYGQDDRICVFCGLEALTGVEAPRHTVALMLWDKEEIGSEGATGASSRFLQYCIDEVRAAWEPRARLADVMLATRALSADVQAALDPDWQEVHEKQNAALLGHGPCFSKFTGSRGKYGANDADAEFVGFMRNILNTQEIPWQMAECGKVDWGGGGTVALHLAAYGMQVIDLGPAVLGMHSPFELTSVADLDATVRAFRAFYAA